MEIDQSALDDMALELREQGLTWNQVRMAQAIAKAIFKLIRRQDGT